MTLVSLLKLDTAHGSLGLFADQVQAVGPAEEVADLPDFLQALGFRGSSAPQERVLTARRPDGIQRWRIGGPLEPLEIDRASLRRRSDRLRLLRFPAWLAGFCIAAKHWPLLLVNLHSVPPNPGRRDPRSCS